MRCDLDGSNARVVNLPSEVGSVGGFGGKMDAKDLYYAFTSFTSRRRFTSWTSPRGIQLVELARCGV